MLKRLKKIFWSVVLAFIFCCGCYTGNVRKSHFTEQYYNEVPILCNTRSRFYRIVSLENNTVGFRSREHPCEIVIEPQYDWAMDFTEGIACVKLNGVYGYIDETGEWLVRPTYDVATPFHSGIAMVKKTGKWFFIDRTQNRISDSRTYFKKLRHIGDLVVLGSARMPVEGIHMCTLLKMLDMDSCIQGVPRSHLICVNESQAAQALQVLAEEVVNNNRTGIILAGNIQFQEQINNVPLKYEECKTIAWQKTINRELVVARSQVEEEYRFSVDATANWIEFLSSDNDPHGISSYLADKVGGQGAYVGNIVVHSPKKLVYRESNISYTPFLVTIIEKPGEPSPILTIGGVYIKGKGLIYITDSMSIKWGNNCDKKIKIYQYYQYSH